MASKKKTPSGESLAAKFNNPRIKGETAAYLNMVQNKILERVSVDRLADIEVAKQIESFLNVVKNTANETEAETLKDLIEDKAAIE